MTISENIPLAEHTTFKIGGPARFFCSVSTEAGLCEAVEFARTKKMPFFILGGGSNILVSDKGFAGLVIKMEMRGIEEKIQDSRTPPSLCELRRAGKIQKKEETCLDSSADNSNQIIVTAAAGEMWDDFVNWAVEHGLSGIENLSAIPGTVGAAPVQNIGAYGAEVAETIVSVHAFDAREMKFVDFSNADCRFAYRDSMFKHEKGRYIITAVTFKLSKNAKVNISYRDLDLYFSAKKKANPSYEPTLSEVRHAVIDIRWNKLPDWKLWGTAGSFFKNPVISANRFARLKKQYPNLPGYPEPDGRVKIPLGWVLEHICDAKGLCMNKACVYEKQALVLVALPGATAEAVVELSHELMKRVKDKTGIEIEGEVEWVN